MATVYVFEPGNAVPTPQITDLYQQLRPWLAYDTDNLYPQRLVGSTKNSPTHVAVMQKKLQFAVGQGLYATRNYTIPILSGEDVSIDVLTNAQSFLDHCSLDGSLQETFKRCISDIINFNGFSLELLYNESNTLITHVKHMPFQDVRVEFPSVDGVVSGYYTSSDWRAFYNARKTPEQAGLPKLAKFNGRANAAKRSLMYEFVYDPELRYYPIPTYASALNFIVTESEISRYFLNSARNNFTPPFAVLFPFTLNEEQEKKNADGIQAYYTGGQNAGKAMILNGQMNADGTSTLPVVTQLGKNDRTNEFNEVYTICREQILMAHGVTSPALMGLSGSATLGGNANEIKVANQMFMNSCIVPIQTMFIDAFAKVLKFNSLDSDALHVRQLDLLLGLATQG